MPARPLAKPKRSPFRWFLLLLLLLCGLLSCAQQGAPSGLECPEIPEGLPVTEAELAYLAALRAHHRAADILESQGALDKSFTEMEEALALPRPEGTAAEEAFLDVAGRAAMLLIRQGLAEKALTLIKDAEKAATRDSFYLAALKMAEGEAHEALGKLLREAGKSEEALAEDLLALDAYEVSQEINGRVLARLKKEEPRKESPNAKD